MTEANRMNAKESAPSRISGEALHKSVLGSIVERNNEAVEAIESIVRGDPIDAAAPVRSDLPFTVNPDGSKSFVTPWGLEYFITADGIECAKQDAKNHTRICGRLEVVADVRTAEGGDRRRLVRWVDADGLEHELLFSVAELLRPNVICARLMTEGLRIDGQIKPQGGVATQIADYLNQCPATDRHTGVKKLGWYGPAGEVFVIPQVTKERIISSAKLEETLIYTGKSDPGAPQYEAKGTLVEWQESVAKLAVYSSRAAFAVCVAFAAPLMAFTAEDSGGFHFYGPSSRGKSTAVRAMCSVWASAESEEMASWRGTDNGFEAVFGARNSLPVILDEIGQAKNSKLMIELTYLFGNNKGKRRMSKSIESKSLASWKTLFLSSGELTVTEAAAKDREEVKSGVLVRMAHIPALPNGADDPRGIFDQLPTDGEFSSAKTVADRINDAAKIRTYGTAGPAFIEEVINDIAEHGRENFIRRLKSRVEEWVKRRTQDIDGQIGRVATRFALVAFAGELAIKYGVLPWPPGLASQYAADCFNAWRENYRTPEQEEAEQIAYLFDQIKAKESRFEVFDVNGNLIGTLRSSSDRIGYLVEGTDKALRTAYIVPSLFEEICLNRNVALTLETLHKRGALKSNGGSEKGVRRYVQKANKGVGMKPDTFVPLNRAYVILADRISV